ncbi:MAG: PIN domain-containing protein [Candidatus Eiseniibacteriota bacterium]
MSRGWLLDTNIISELSKGVRADGGVRTWVEQTPEDELYLTVLTLGEIAKGLALGEARARDMSLHRHFLEHELPDRFGNRILAFDADAAAAWGRMMSGLPGNRDDERRLAIDGQIAAIAESRSLGICTRNVRDFELLGVGPITNPFHAR